MNQGPVESAASVREETGTRADEGLLEDARIFIRQNPTRALAIAAGAGFVLQSAPVGRLLGGLLRVGFALTQPALMVLGGLKIWEKIQRRQIL